MLTGMNVLVLLVAFAGWTAAASDADEPSMDTRIVGGFATDIKNHQHLVVLRYEGSFQCGGSLVTTTHVVTASHCVEDDRSSPAKYSIRAGSSSVSSGGVIVKVSKIWMHPKYNTRTTDYDIAVLKLAEEAVGTSITPIELATKRPPNGAMINVAGWGLTSDSGGIYPNNVRAVNVPVVGKQICRNKYGAGVITKRMMCAGKKGKDSCSGDSGGPLVRDGKLLGVVSWGYGCADPNYPGVYADVVTLRPFVLSKLKL